MKRTLCLCEFATRLSLLNFSAKKFLINFQQTLLCVSTNRMRFKHSCYYRKYGIFVMHDKISHQFHAFLRLNFYRTSRNSTEYFTKIFSYIFVVIRKQYTCDERHKVSCRNQIFYFRIHFFISRV